ncbi:phage tail protein [Sporocytophaga myxococcoides]|uniref:phage tail protein n=1 Tax=Sporocytophaga myxococcoides TaxID=153721 RepID=UPI0003FB553E
MKPKCFLLFSLMFCICFAAFAQPEAINYQGVARSADGQPLISKAIVIRASITKDAGGESAEYSEQHSVTTSPNGLFNLALGKGTVLSGVFTKIGWGDGDRFLKIEMNVDSKEFAVLGVTQLLSVPYALYAANAATANISAKSPLNFSNKVIGLNAGTQAGDLMTWDGVNWVSKAPETKTLNNMQPYTVINYCIALQGIFPSRDGAQPYVAEIMLFAGNFAPKGFAICDGRLLPINQNQALFSLLGTNYGGDGRTTFALPDLRGRVPISAGTGPGLSTYTEGQTGGSETIVR